MKGYILACIRRPGAEEDDEPGRLNISETAQRRKAGTVNNTFGDGHLRTDAIVAEMASLRP